MNNSGQNLKTAFGEAPVLTGPNQRPEYLNPSCAGGDQDLRQKIHH